MPDEKPPSVDAVVRRIDEPVLPRQLVVETVRTVVDRFREDPSLDIDAEVGRRLDGIRLSIPHRVINATGVLLHTNLGRAPWIPEAVSAAAEVAGSYSNVELDLGSGERGRRNAMSERLLVALTGAEAALVVNNNAAAVFLVLAVLAGRNGRVPVSRGELIEIGGSYRLPELMAATGADLVEVGTTNRTRLEDYQAVEDACLILKVHPSNYQIVGFSNEAPVSDLAGLASDRSIPLVFDDGSGLLDNRVPWLGGPPPQWLGGEPGVRQSLEAGADLVLFSGDKLLGGPQAG
ncbi:MAG: L-seryl-tRNA(Sec) selenium transferase, partial [Acidimicrobiia bacterium]